MKNVLQMYNINIYISNNGTFLHYTFMVTLIERTGFKNTTTSIYTYMANSTLIQILKNSCEVPIYSSFWAGKAGGSRLKIKKEVS